MQDFHFFRWFVSLSNGETYFEYKSKIPTWSELLQYIEREKVKITSLGLYTVTGLRLMLPSHGKNPKFSQFNDNEAPIAFNMRRRVSQDFVARIRKTINQNTTQELYTTIEAEYEKYKLQIWADEISRTNIWTNFILK